MNKRALTLFVADDDELFKRILKINLVRTPLFRHEFYFDNGQPLINYLKQHHDHRSNLPDILFLDLEMPGSNGWEVLETLKVLQGRLIKQPLIYIVTVSILTAHKEKALSYNFVKGFISKPITADQLFSIATGTFTSN